MNRLNIRFLAAVIGARIFYAVSSSSLRCSARKIIFPLGIWACISSSDRYRINPFFSFDRKTFLTFGFSWSIIACENRGSPLNPFLRVFYE
jgi:hypothetical protein